MEGLEQVDGGEDEAGKAVDDSGRPPARGPTPRGAARREAPVRPARGGGGGRSAGRPKHPPVRRGAGRRDRRPGKAPRRRRGVPERPDPLTQAPLEEDEVGVVVDEHVPEVGKLAREERAREDPGHDREMRGEGRHGAPGNRAGPARSSPPSPKSWCGVTGDGRHPLSTLDRDASMPDGCSPAEALDPSGRFRLGTGRPGPQERSDNIVTMSASAIRSRPAIPLVRRLAGRGRSGPHRARRSRGRTAGDGPFGRRVEERLSERLLVADGCSSPPRAPTPSSWPSWPWASAPGRR